MPKYVIRFIETQRGWYEFEADNLDHAKQLVAEADLDTFSEAFYKDGVTEFDGEPELEQK